MKYALYEGPGRRGQPQWAGEFSDKFSAESGAKNWVKAHGAADRYTLESEDGSLAMSVFRTQAGQWYMTPKAAAQ
jgi:hypothetical protein